MRQSFLFLFPMFLLGARLIAMGQDKQNLKIKNLEIQVETLKKQVETLSKVSTMQWELLEKLTKEKIRKNEIKHNLQKQGMLVGEIFYFDPKEKHLKAIAEKPSQCPRQGSTGRKQTGTDTFKFNDLIH